jgi:beta-galactosidase/beta-glucuronidase
MRKFSVNSKYFLLNNKPYFVHGLLDQGYYPEGIYTPASYKAYQNDILTMKELGFNCLRKHIKIEPMRFYYYCDKYGMLVFQDIVNNGDYSFMIDTAMPTIGLNKLAMSFKKTSDETKQIYKQSLIDTVNYFYNVPCIGYYTIFNEGWGQHDADYYYNLLKEIDNTRILDSTSGWFKETLSDVESLHVYFKPIKLKPSNKAIIVSEFGGYAYSIKDHEFNTQKVYGYKKFNNSEDFNKAIINLFETDIINNIKYGLAGSIYTQVSDVEDETNGLLTYDRKILKVNENDFIEIKNKIDKEFYHD